MRVSLRHRSGFERGRKHCPNHRRDSPALPANEVEIIVVDGGSQDGTPQRVPSGARLILARRGRAIQMNTGAAASAGEVLVFCHADTSLPSGWREAAIDALAKPGVSGSSFQIEFIPFQPSSNIPFI